MRSVTGGGTINLQCGLKNNYDFTKRVQVIRIPRFENLTVNAGASIVPTLWNGTSGGVVALEVNTDLTMNAGSLISADASGFRGGQVDLTGASGSNVAPQTRFLGSSNPAEGSEKGESIFGYHAEYDYFDAITLLVAMVLALLPTVVAVVATKTAVVGAVVPIFLLDQEPTQVKEHLLVIQRAWNHRNSRICGINITRWWTRRICYCE